MRLFFLPLVFALLGCEDQQPQRLQERQVKESIVFKGDIADAKLIGSFLKAVDSKDLNVLAALSPNISILELALLSNGPSSEPWIVEGSDAGVTVARTYSCAGRGMISYGYRLEISKGHIESAKRDNSLSMLEC